MTPRRRPLHDPELGAFFEKMYKEIREAPVEPSRLAREKPEEWERVKAYWNKWYPKQRLI